MGERVVMGSPNRVVARIPVADVGEAASIVSAIPEVREALRAALSAAATARPVAQPLDWMESRTPREWIIDGKRVTYDWS